MSMKKKLKIAGVIFGIFVLIIVFLLCYKAGNHMAERQRQEEQLELTVTPLPTEEPEESITPVPDIFGQQEEEAVRQSNKKYKFLDFAENLGDLFTEKQIKKIKKTTKKYLNNSRTHAEADTVTCTGFHYRSQTRNQIYGYLKLDDGSMLQYTYDFDSNEVKVMETAVTRRKQTERGKNRRRRSLIGEKLLLRRLSRRPEVQHPIPIHPSAVPDRTLKITRQYRMIIFRRNRKR